MLANSLRLAIVFSFLFTGCATPPQKAMAPIPLEDFFKNPVSSSFEISPNAEYVSYLAPYKGRMNIFLKMRDGLTEPVQLTEVLDRDISGYFWKGPATIVFLRDFNGDENYQLFAIDIKTKAVTALTPFQGVRTEIIDDLDRIDNDNLIIGLNKRNREIFDAFKLNVKTGKMTQIAKNPGNIEGWMTDHRGKLRLAITSDGVNKSILVRNKESDPFHPLLKTNFRESVDPLFFTFDNKNLYVNSNRGRDKSALATLDLKTGEEKVFFDRPDVDISSLSFSKKRHVLWTALFETWHLERHFFDPQIQSIFESVQAKIPSYEIGITGSDDDEKYFLVRASSDVSRGAYYLYDSESKNLQKLAELSPWIDSAQMSPMKPIEYKSRDGLTIRGYLTLPKGSDSKNLPVVVNPHGGPWARDSWGYNPEVQFLASRGYAVLQMNFRGSTGYGRKFWEASFKEWGHKMQDDISDGVQWLVQEKIANPNRVAIYGGSYGGYATLAGLTLTPDLYACGVDYVGVSNLFTFMNTIPPYWKPFMEEMKEQVGDPKKDEALLRAASPVFHVDKIKAPLFVAQGAKDPRVNIAESNQIVEALKKRGVAVDYMVKENEGHGFHNEENRFDFYRAMEGFLGKHL